MAQIENEFWPFLNNWFLVVVVLAFMGYWAKINCIDPKLKKLRTQKSSLPNGTSKTD